MAELSHVVSEQTAKDKWAKFKHHGWGWVVSALLIFVATIAADPLRVGSLSCAVLFAVYAFHNTEFAAKNMRKTSIAAVIFAAIGVLLFYGAHDLDYPTERHRTTTQVNNYQVMTNAQLRNAAQDFAARLRAWNPSEIGPPLPNESLAQHNRRSIVQTQQQNRFFSMNFAGEGRSIEMEIRRRCKLSEPTVEILGISEYSGYMELKTGQLAGAAPIENVALYFDWLGKQIQ